MSTNSSRPQRRQTIHHYRNALDQEDIIVPEDPRSIEDLAIAREESNLQDILEFSNYLMSATRFCSAGIRPA
jgi:hypothetical protein